VTLIADLGCFTITTNPAATKSMSPDEVAIYEAFVVKVWLQIGIYKVADIAEAICEPSRASEATFHVSQSIAD
jgi:hypothetical protein